MNLNHFFWNLIAKITHCFQIGTVYFNPHPNMNPHRLPFYYQYFYLFHSNFGLILFHLILELIHWNCCLKYFFADCLHLNWKTCCLQFLFAINFGFVKLSSFSFLKEFIFLSCFLIFLLIFFNNLYFGFISVLEAKVVRSFHFHFFSK